MATKYTLDSSSVSQNRLLPLLEGAIQLSDGTAVFLHRPGTASTLTLSYSADRSTVTDIDASLTTFTLSAVAQQVSLLRDSSDNLYVIGPTTTGNAAVVAYTKGAGLTWTKQAASASFAINTSTGNCGWFTAAWCNTGGGTNSKGHIFFTNGWSDTGSLNNDVYTIDAGKALLGTMTSSDVQSKQIGVAYGLTACTISPDGFGATSGLFGFADQGGSRKLVYVYSWSLTSAGVVTLTLVSTNEATFTSGPSRTRLLRVSSNLWAYVHESSTVSGQFAISAWSSSARLAAATAVTAPTGWTNGATGAGWDAMCDGTGKVWVYQPDSATVTTMDRLGCAVSASAVTWDSAVVADDTAVGTVGHTIANTTVRCVTGQITAAGRSDWQVFSHDTTAVTFAALGDYSVLPLPPGQFMVTT